MVAHLKTFTNKGCKIALQEKLFWANFARSRRLYNKYQEVIQQASGGYSQDFFGIGDTIRIGREMLCLLYAEFFSLHLQLKRWSFIREGLLPAGLPRLVFQKTLNS